MNHPHPAGPLALLLVSLAVLPARAQEGGPSEFKDVRAQLRGGPGPSEPIPGKAVAGAAAPEAPRPPDAPPAFSMGEVSGSVDIAESSLRILLNEPAAGKFPSAMLTEASQLEAAQRLLGVELRSPGLLKHEGFSDWRQFQEVRRLFRKLEEKNQFYYHSTAAPPVQGAARIASHESKERIGSTVEAVDVSGLVDVAESSLRVILNKPASGKFPKGMVSGEQKTAACLRLLNIQLRFPGLLEGKYSFPFEWKQYAGTAALFEDYSKR
mgnify:FL=1